MVLSRAINHGATVPTEHEEQKQGDESLTFLLGLAQSLITFLYFEISTHILEWKYKVTQNKLLIGKPELPFKNDLLKYSIFLLTPY